MLSYQGKEQDKQSNFSLIILSPRSLFREETYQIMSSEIVCMEIQNNELILNDDEGVIHESNELDNGNNTPQLQEDNEEKY